MEASNNADDSRHALQQMRESLSKASTVDITDLAMIDCLVQSGLEEKAYRLGLKCDAIGRQLSALQSKRGSV
jgi:hypothetical protein